VAKIEKIFRGHIGINRICPFVAKGDCDSLPLSFSSLGKKVKSLFIYLPEKYSCVHMTEHFSYILLLETRGLSFLISDSKAPEQANCNPFSAANVLSNTI
jgi:hypothetical protein